MRSEFVLCPLRFYRRFILKLVPKGAVSIDLHAGQAFAKGLEIARKSYYDLNAPTELALEAGIYSLIDAWGDFNESPDENKSLPNMLGALVSYIDTYPFDTDPLVPLRTPLGSMTEFSFSIPIDEVRHPQTGEPLIYFGRADMIGELGKDGPKFVVDEKTTSRLGSTWASQWEMRGQMSGYTWAARRMGYPVEGALIRGISILKNGYGHVEALTYRPQWEVDRWYNQLIRDIKRMIACWQEDVWDAALDTACSMFKPCPYMPLCDVENPDEWLGDYETRVWNPLAP
jgi:hypothetical protein